LKINRVLVTGSNGFVGKHLIQHLKKNSIECLSFPETIDIREKKHVINFCSNYSFDGVIHLAAKIFIPRAIENPQETYDVNVTGTKNLLEALKLNDFCGVFLFIGSSDVYGVVSESHLPIIEDMPLSPLNPYSQSKVKAEELCKKWSETEQKMRIVMTRSFSHIGPLQNERFVISGFCKQVAMMSNEVQKPYLETGNLDITRDFTDVRDIVYAYHLLLESGRDGEVYNVCSGREVLLKDFLLKLKQISNIDFEVRIISDLHRNTEQQRVLGSFDKLNKITGWKPKILFDTSILHIYNYWLEKTKMEFKS
jgi:GDP-4-dehydro-6-deoxy-D-mannose reductase